MRAIIFHGTGLKPENFWYPWLKDQLAARGYQVEVPYFPDINEVFIGDFLPKVIKSVNIDSETVLIGHSSGAPLILSLLENASVVIKKAVLVAGYSQDYTDGDIIDPILQEKYDWKKIKAHAQEFIFINSDNDPWGCDDKQGRKMFDELGGTQVVRHDGHFGSESHNQPYPTFPLLLSLVLGETK